ncbi:MAG: hypothetical protein LCH91_27010 [Bacteroidetes bacterium]|nr:hypothetical protein [Bacteroidota bacterium]
MRHIINFIGISSYKETVLLALMQLLPHFVLFRLENLPPEQEADEWRKTWIASLEADACILYSDGNSEHLSLLLDRLWRAPGTNIFTLDMAELEEDDLTSSSSINQLLKELLPADFQ